MATKQAVSTVSYNSEAFLTEVLDKLVKQHIISFYAWIFHYGEYDKNLNYYDKNHIHLYIQPNQMIDLMDLKDLFSEPDPNNDKPLGCISFNTSNWDDFFLYNLHDVNYLKSKCLEREFHYKIEDYHSNDYDDFMYRAMKTYSLGNYASNKNLVTYIDNGGQLGDLARSGGISPNRAVGMYYFHELLKSSQKNCNTYIDK